MNILALDLSLTETGWARQRFGVRKVGIIPPSKHCASGEPRLARIRGYVLDLAEGADLVVLEGFAFGAKGDAVYEIAGLGYVVRLALFEAGLPYVVVPPTTLKSYLAGHGHAKKEAMLAAAIRRLGYEGHNHNEADALGLLAAALEWYGEPMAAMPQAQVAALAKVAWPRLAELRREAPRVSPVGG